MQSYDNSDLLHEKSLNETILTPNAENLTLETCTNRSCVRLYGSSMLLKMDRKAWTRGAHDLALTTSDQRE